MIRPLLSLAAAFLVGTALTASAAESTAEAPTSGDKPPGPVILFLIDNSASLPPLDPDEKRVAALEKMFTFLQGQPYRLILFGGRHEVFVDDVSQYKNNGQWTDFYFAFEKAAELVKGYPAGTEFRLVLLTDAIVDPGPRDWADMNVPEGNDVRTESIQRTLSLIGNLKLPLYVILVGEARPEMSAPGDREQAPTLILDMVRTANGAQASPLAQTLASFFSDNGVLLRKFVFRVAPNEGLAKLEPVIKRVAAPSSAKLEVQVVSFLILPLFLFLFLLLGILVRSFPGPGDLEIVEANLGVPVHLGVDRTRKVEGGWATQGLSLVGDARDAAGTLTYSTLSTDLSGKGLDTDGLDDVSRRLLPLALEDLRRSLDHYANGGSKDEKIYALNLDYMAKNFDPDQAERLLTVPIPERRRVGALDFLRAKVHLLSNDDLREKLTEPRAQLVTYGKAGDRKDVVPGALLRLGRYGFIVRDMTRGGRKDVRITLYYDRVPSLLGLKTILPDAFQRIFRFRRSSQRIVT